MTGTLPASGAPGVAATRAAIDAVWRVEAPRIVAALARMVRDVGLAEEVAQDALVAALEHWPHEGVPGAPGAWLLATARNRAVDRIRRDRSFDERARQLGRDERQRQLDDPGIDLDELLLEQDFAGDDLLRLLHATCHPALSRPARVALTLRLLGGLTTGEVARAFLTSEPTIAQRISRAKQRLREEPEALDLPSGAALTERLDSVCEVVYLIFNEGYAATSGSDLTRPDLCAEALRLGRALATLAPGHAEVQGLLALIELQASRLAARAGPDGEPILLLDQDRGRWDQLLVRRGLAALDRALALPDPGPYALQAAIAACHARARRPDETDWRTIAAIYDRLVDLMPSPVIELNRAVAVSMVDGPAPALQIVDGLIDLPVLREYHLLPSVRGDLLRRLDREEEARGEFAKAAKLARNDRERALLERRAAGEDA